jgi:hypothetical protein
MNSAAAFSLGVRMSSSSCARPLAGRGLGQAPLASAPQHSRATRRPPAHRRHRASAAALDPRRSHPGTARRQILAATPAPLPSAVLYPDKPSIKIGLDVHLDFIMAVAQRDHAAPQTPRKFTPAQLVLQVDRLVELSRCAARHIVRISYAAA